MFRVVKMDPRLRGDDKTSLEVRVQGDFGRKTPRISAPLRASASRL